MTKLQTSKLSPILSLTFLLSAAALQCAGQVPNSGPKQPKCEEISTFAGNHVAGYSGDGGPATSAELNGPTGLAVGTQVVNGNTITGLFITDSFNNRIRVVDFATGNIYTFAGNGIQGYTPNETLPIDTELHTPTGLVFNGGGNGTLGTLYYADTGNNVVRAVGPYTNGFVVTVAGTPGSFGYAGDNAAATAALLHSPVSVTFDSVTSEDGVSSHGNLYIADSANQVIRRVDGVSGFITTAVGNGKQGSSGDGGSASSAEFNNPSGVVSDAAGDLYIADTGNSKIRQITVTGNGLNSYSGTVETIAGTGTAGSEANSELHYPQGVALSPINNAITVSDTDNDSVVDVGTASSLERIAGNGTAGYTGDGGLSTIAELNQPIGIAYDSAGNIYIADNLNNVVRKLTTVSSIICKQ